MEKMELRSGWRVARYPEREDGPERAPSLDGLDWMEASVPGAVHYDLVAAGLLANPYESSESAFAAEWVAQSDWVYRAEFEIAAQSLVSRDFVLRVLGIDTFAALWINGHRLGETSNAFRSYDFDVANGLLRAGSNELLVHVKSHYRMIGPKMEAARRMGRKDKVSGMFGKSLIRRYQRSFYASASLLNLGTGVLGIGIFRPIELLAIEGAYLKDIDFRTTLLTGAVAQTTTRVEVAGPGLRGDVTVEILLSAGDRTVARGESILASGALVAEIKLDVVEPELWWPSGYGEQKLYRLDVRLTVGETLVDAREMKVGFKTVELVEEEPDGRPTYHLTVNGTKVFVRGENLLPLDYLKAHGEDGDYERMLRLAVHQGCNLIRIWGGGVPESQRFYDRCDELGLMVFQDFFLHSNVYPDYDDDFVRDFEAESIGLVHHVGNHAALVLLCGGNELQEGWDEWGWKDEIDRPYGLPLATDLCRRIAAEHCPGIPFIENSPHGGKWAQSPTKGDMHCWGGLYNSTKDPLFVTETCWHQESYSRPETLKEVMSLDVDEHAGLGWHEAWNRVTKLSLIIRLPFSNHFDVGSLRSYLYSLEVEQARADYHALNMLRMRGSSLNGLIYWSFNKGGPLFGYGCVDYRGRPLMSYYIVKRVFADLAVHIYRDLDDIRIVGSNLGRDVADCELVLVHAESSGRRLREWRQPVRLAPDRPVRLVDLPDYYKKIMDRTNEALYAGLFRGDELLCDDMLYFCPFSEFGVREEALKIVSRRSGAPDSWSIELEAGAVAQMVQLEGNRRLLISDNYFPLVPGVRKKITATLLDAGESSAAPEFEPGFPSGRVLVQKVPLI